MKFLFFFMDGIGLGQDDRRRNPFAQAEMPNLSALLGGERLIGLPPGVVLESERATLLPLDACLGVAGLPQSASGQAALLTGVNAPAILGEHFGPKPNPAIAEILANGNLFETLKEKGRRVALLNAYPQAYFTEINSGQRLPGAVAMAALESGLPLMNADDLFAGRALSADFTGKGWRERLGYHDTPLLSFNQAGARLAELTRNYDFALFEFWVSDVLGHRKDMHEACLWLKRFDQVLGGLLDAWNDDEGLILIASDHGNLEDLGTRRHTDNPVPALVIGAPDLRHSFSERLGNLTDIMPAILRFFDVE
ncbi:MAG: metalloenzyme domain-containing protein [Chloroflexi bacterium]|nr:metalloenzyme domain-containing protein [Chloroflexota bacterium]